MRLPILIFCQVKAFNSRMHTLLVVCSPTRASIMTGKHPARVNITDWIPGVDPKNKPLLGPKDLHYLPLGRNNSCRKT